MDSAAQTLRDDPPAPVRWPLPGAEEADQETRDNLASLRAELDRLDDAIQDLLIDRAEIVRRVATTKPPGGVALRPGREAAILRRLLARHHGTLPANSIVRIWRELLAATTAMQARFAIAVCDTDPGRAFTQLAREHFGALTPLTGHRSPAQAIAEVSAGRASLAILPLPSDTESAAEAWWTALLQKDEPRIHVVARLPFYLPRPEGAPTVQALVAAAIAPDPSGDDRSLLGLELAPDISRARLANSLAAADLGQGGIILRRDPGAALALIEVGGLVTEQDPRLARITAAARPPVVLGSYAVPIGAGA